jgi:hypothetical protein
MHQLEAWLVKNSCMVEQDATEQTVGSEGVVKQVPGKEVCSIEQTVQLEAVTESSGGQLEVGRQTSGDESMADATTEHSTIMVEETVEAKAVPFMIVCIFSL